MSSVALLNGTHGANVRHLDEVGEYNKILRIRDQVFAGNHPRLTVSSNAVSKAIPSVQPVTNTVHLLPLPVSTVLANFNLPGLQLHENNIPGIINGSTPAVSIPHARPPLPPPSTSELDPLFLTKSDELIKAETILQRRRLESALREQLDQKRSDARYKTALTEAKPDFDVSDVLAKALARVPPISFDSARDNYNASASESVDENSFYSSRAPDSTPERHDGRSQFSKCSASSRSCRLT